MNIHWETLADSAVSQIWQVTVAVLLVAGVVRMFCRHRPHLAYLLWMLVLIKCLTPPLWSSPTGIFSWATAESRQPAVTDAVPRDTIVLANTSEITEEDQPPAGAVNQEPTHSTPHDVPQLPEPAAAPGKTVADKTDVQAAASLWGQIDWRIVAASIWISGVVLSLATVAGRRLATSIVLRRSCRPASEALQTRLGKIAARLRIGHGAELLISERPLGPAVFGILRPKIVLPNSLAFDKPCATLDSILAHELVHFRRGDTLTGWLQLAVQALWWFHPMVWCASRAASRERERCCDEETVAGLACDPGEYAQSLVDVLRQRRLKPLFHLPGMRTVEITTRRLNHILRHHGAFHRRTPPWCWLAVLLMGALLLPGGGINAGNHENGTAPDSAHAVPLPALPQPGEWPQFCGSSHRNNVAQGGNIPARWDAKSGSNILWSARLGTQTYNSPVVAGGRLFIGTNNGGAYLERYPKSVDLACLLCFDEQTGDFLWQYSSEKLPTGRMHDWPTLGLCSAPYAENDRLWVVTNRCEVVCLDADGFLDGTNDGPIKSEPAEAKNEADVLWKFDMMARLGVRPHNQTSCSVTCAGDVLLVGTSNGVEESHQHLAAPSAPSFIALDRNTGRLLWRDASPGANVLHGQWSSPAYGVFDGVPQAIFAGGDGFLYSFDLRDIKRGKSNLLWWFDANPKESQWILGGRGTRNNIIATPVIYDGLVYITVGQNPEHGEGPGHVWCVDPMLRGDISPELVYNERDRKTPIPHKRLQACDAGAGDFVRKNPNSGVVWHYAGDDRDGDGKLDFEETMHRSVGSTAIRNNLLVVADFSGLVHCLDAKTGKPYWTHDQFAASTGTPLIVDGKAIIGDEDGDVTVFKLAKKLEVLAENNMGNAIYGTPVSVRDVLYITTKQRLFAIGREQAAAPRALQDRGAGWRLPRGNARNQGVAGTAPPEQLKLKWKLDVGDKLDASPVVAGNMAVVGTADGRLFAVDLTTGRVFWLFDANARFAASPAIRDQKVYIGDSNGRFYCVDLMRGRTIWSNTLPDSVDSAATVWNDRVVIGSRDGTVTCLDAATGRRLWTHGNLDRIQSIPAVVDNTVIVSACDSKLHLLDTATGREIAKFDLDGPTMSSPAVLNKRVFVGTESGTLYGFDINKKDMAWEKQLADTAIRSSAAIVKQYLVIGAHDNNIYAVDNRTGEPLWSFATRARVEASPVIAGNRVLMGADDGRIYVLDLKSGSKIAEIEVGGQIVGSAAIANGLVVVATSDGKIYVYGE